MFTNSIPIHQKNGESNMEEIVRLQVSQNKSDNKIKGATFTVPSWYVRFRQLDGSSRFSFKHHKFSFFYSLLQGTQKNEISGTIFKLRIFKSPKYKWRQHRLTIPLRLARELNLKQGKEYILTEEIKGKAITLVFSPLKTRVRT